ncbi:MAG: DUF4012 domain-containing protein, partial [Parcubacteria group bacterium]|nr:DUF4012 domain-containing protein [Parcubacteria group bacterium]
MKKQNKTAVKPKSLSSRKTARDAESHLDFSITKKVIHADNYEALVRKRAYAHRKADALAHLSGKNERVQTARAELAGTESRGAQTHLLPVHVGALPRSPHVVRLLGEWERTALSAIEPKKGGAASASRGASPDAGERWQREVARLRSQTAHTKHVARGITIDLLGKPSRGAKKRKKREKFAFSSLPAKAGSGLKKAAFASLRWLFEFVLSIPLGFLLGFTVLLTLIEASNRLSVRGARSLGAGVSWLIQHVFFVIIAAVKAILVIPVKLVTFACMAAYRAVASGGLLALVAATALWEGAKNYVSVFTRPPKHLYRKLAVLTAIGIVVMLPVKFLETAPDQIRLLKGSVLGATKDGYQGLASLDLESAQASFASARSAIESLNLVMAVAVSVLPAGQDGLHAITAGDELAEAARYLADAVAPPHGAGGEAGGLALLSRIQESLTASLPHLALAAENISAIDPRNIPPEFSEKFRAARDLLPRVAGAVQDGSELFAILADVLGANGDRRYVVLFQNNNELRPAGGFIGSLAFVDVRGGKVTNIEVPGGGAYDFQGYLSEHVLAPKPLSLINARWELQDA